MEALPASGRRFTILNLALCASGGGRGIRTLDPDFTRSKRLAGARTRPLCDPSASCGPIHYATRLSNQQTMKALRNRSWQSLVRLGPVLRICAAQLLVRLATHLCFFCDDRGTMLSMRQENVPAGAATSSVCPTCLPEIALPKGEATESLPLAGFASRGSTSV